MLHLYEVYIQMKHEAYYLLAALLRRAVPRPRLAATMMRSTTWSIVDKHIDSNKLYEDLIVIFANDMFSSMKISAAWQVIAPSESSLRVIAPNASPH